MNLPTTTTTAHQTLHFMSYPDPGVPHWLAARIALHRDQLGAVLELRPGLTPREQLRAHAWAGRVLEQYLTADRTRFDTGRQKGLQELQTLRGEPGGDSWRLYGPVLRTGDLDGTRGAGGYGISKMARPSDVVCLDCSHRFNPDYSPHLDRCAGCAEDFDAEADR